MRTLPFPLFYRLSRFRFFDLFFRNRRDSIRYDKKPTSAASKAISHQPTFRARNITKLTPGSRKRVIPQVYESLCMSGRESFMAMGAIAAKRIAIKTNWPKTSRGKDRCGIRATAEFSAQKPKPAQIIYLFCILFISERLPKEVSIAFQITVYSKMNFSVQNSLPHTQYYYPKMLKST